MVTAIDFKPSAHCETGVTAALLRHHGLDLSEAMVFGIGAGLFFAYVPFVKVGGLPLTAYRDQGGRIFSRCTANLGIRTRFQRFRDPAAATAALDAMIDAGQPVGVQAGIFWLPYWPPHMRLHFNMHNVMVYAREGDDYLISDAVLGQLARCPRADLENARFATGGMAPRGAMYYISQMNPAPDLAPAILKGIRTTCSRMLSIPLPWMGISATGVLAKRMRRWPERLGADKAAYALTNVIRLQEETGTGGAGFRFIYAAFLQEAAEFLNDAELADLAERMTAVGDTWREFAAGSARICKGRASDVASYGQLADLLEACGRSERAVFTSLRAWAKGRR